MSPHSICYGVFYLIYLYLLMNCIRWNAYFKIDAYLIFCWPLAFLYTRPCFSFCGKIVLSLSLDSGPNNLLWNIWKTERLMMFINTTENKFYHLHSQVDSCIVIICIVATHIIYIMHTKVIAYVNIYIMSLLKF